MKAFKEGDAIMILIVEDTQANNSAETNESRNTDLNAGVTYSGGNTNFSGQAGLSTGNAFKGQGQNSRNEKIRSQLSARITGVETNGNLKIEGTRTTKVNGETQKIIIKGVVRPVDVMANNSIYSYNILDLTLLIDGDGNVSKIQEPGLITKFLRFLF
ncbi:MAG: flagellar basal body L-ring protein FlgH [FCB group bacterium]